MSCSITCGAVGVDALSEEPAREPFPGRGFADESPAGGHAADHGRTQRALQIEHCVVVFAFEIAPKSADFAAS